MKYALLIFSFALVLSACKKKTEECKETAGSTVASVEEEKAVTDYLAANGITNAVELENSGLYYIMIAAGNDKKPGQCSSVKAKYTGRLVSGVIFDQTTGDNTAIFSLQRDQFGNGLIQGWKRALPLIGEQGKIKLIVPPALGYGASDIINSSTGVLVIPKNSILIFDIEIVTVF